MIVAPKPNFAFDPESDEKMVERFRNDIWYVALFCSLFARSRCERMRARLTVSDRPTVEKLNAFAPTHSRVFKEVCFEWLHSRDGSVANDNQTSR